MKKILMIAFAWLTLSSLPSQAAGWLPKPAQVSPHVWVWVGPLEGPNQTNRGYRMNLGFVQGKTAVAVIDSGYTPEMAHEMLRRIRDITPLPVRYVINTNSQPHRFMGNDVFRATGAEIIAARDAAARMENAGADFVRTITQTLAHKDGTIVPPKAPDHLLDENQSRLLDLGGGVQVKVSHWGRAHTRGSMIAEVIPDQTVFAGDILYSGRLLSVLPDSHVGQWIAAYDRLRPLKAKQFVPGHGEVAPLSGFEHSTYRYLTKLTAHMDQAVKNGVGPSEASKRFDATGWRALANFDELAGRNASLAYLEAEAEGF
ncbi:MAG: MBL fold metallo-hydrolase [Thiobacillus sp.]|nr:MBL fold metallo-hydrolase [Thiobacillus sp.]